MLNISINDEFETKTISFSLTYFKNQLSVYVRVVFKNYNTTALVTIFILKLRKAFNT